MQSAAMRIVGIVVVLCAAGFAHGGPRSAWPQIMLFHGPSLNERATIAGVSDVERFLESLEPVDMQGNEAGRPAIQVAMYWDPEKWRSCVTDAKCLRHLDPSDAEQVAVYYPGFNERPAFFSARGFSGVIRNTGLEMLEERGIPLK